MELKQSRPDIQNSIGELIIKVFAYRSFGNIYMGISSLVLLLIWTFWFEVPFDSLKNYFSWFLVLFSFLLGLSLILWTLFGVEKLSIKGNEVKFTRAILFIELNKSFNKNNLSKFTVDYSDVDILSKKKSILFGTTIGKIRFTNQGKRYSFGLSLNNSDADKICEYINSRINANTK